MSVAEIQRGEVTDLLNRKFDSEAAKEIGENHDRIVAEEMRHLYILAGSILHGYNIAPGEIGNDPARISHPHILTPGVPFTSNGEQVQIRLSEITRRVKERDRDIYQRYGVRIELADDAISSSKRRLFDISENAIEDYKGDVLTPRNVKLSEIEEVRALIERIRHNLPVPEGH
jgi:hypothetical protein